MENKNLSISESETKTRNDGVRNQEQYNGPGEVHGRQLYLIMGGVILGLLLAALDQTVVGPAMFRIIRDLRGLEHYAWVTTAYLLTSTITVPIAGKLGDMFGRKWFFVTGMVIFIGASMLCGLSSGTEPFSLFGITVPGLTVGMAELIFFRAIQGIGGGLMTANAFAIVGDVVAPADRGRWQGLFGAVFGVASIIGPTIGGFITDNIGWEWVFFVNVPVGLIAIPMVSLTFPNIVQARGDRRSIDWLGAFTLAGAVTPVLLALSLGGSRDFPWDSPAIWTMFAVGAVFVGLFLWRESRATAPIIPLDLFKNRIFTLSVITVMLVGFGMFGAMINLPLFIQGVQGQSATTSGNAILPLMFGAVVFSIISGQIVSRTGKYRILAITGQIIIAIGMFLLSTMTIDVPGWKTALYMVVMGIGLGIAQPLYTLIVQNAFPPQRLGVVTSAVTFFRSIGGTLGVAIFGTIVNNRFSSEYQALLPAQIKSSPQFGSLLSGISPQALISPDTLTAIQTQLQNLKLPVAQIQQIITAITAPIKPALATATTEAFLIGAIVLAVSTVFVVFIPEIALRRSTARAAASTESRAIEGAPEALSPDLVSQQ
ncbi:MAG: MDR family MFS transporter [Chloroflexia bacterium]